MFLFKNFPLTNTSSIQGLLGSDDLDNPEEFDPFKSTYSDDSSYSCLGLNFHMPEQSPLRSHKKSFFPEIRTQASPIYNRSQSVNDNPDSSNNNPNFLKEMGQRIPSPRTFPREIPNSTSSIITLKPLALKNDLHFSESLIEGITIRSNIGVNIDNRVPSR